MAYSLLSDEELVLRLKAGDADAVKEIYNRYWKEILLTYHRKLHDQELAEELTQNLFISLWEKRNSAEIKHLRFYLFGAVKYSIINYHKALSIKNKHLDYYRLDKQEQENVTEKQVLLHDLSLAIEKGIELLPVKTKQVFRLSRMQHHSVKEISSDLNISEKAVEYHISRSVKVLKLYLKEYLLTLTLMLLLLH
ncbi:RNA polymerase sigma factor [Mucilaginibacter arboris]|uniref:Sigma-70 family RNA polymerase sigma factor n=1 Tax=Mucilaginibacter arboris TaxID=2682090 RepID=A0A7K1SUQ5_9SPHI|nr:sigma-70 family RNA polymerase sigma factor [Mucilaginibacter arboris]MVN21072.1 sigma-70 family RNA polymerase sigma factor [Mucilaginibacter arboris]